MCLMCPTAEKDHRQGGPLSAWMGRATEKDLAKEAFWSPATRCSKKDWWGHNSCRLSSPCPCTLSAALVPVSQAAVPSWCSTLPGAELPQAKKSLTSMHTGSLQSFSTLCDPVDCGLPGLSVREGVVLCPHSRSRDRHRVGGHPREVSWTVTPSEGKDSDSTDSRKTFFILMFWLAL